MCPIRRTLTSTPTLPASHRSGCLVAWVSALELHHECSTANPYKRINRDAIRYDTTMTTEILTALIRSEFARSSTAWRLAFYVVLSPKFSDQEFRRCYFEPIKIPKASFLKAGITLFE